MSKSLCSCPDWNKLRRMSMSHALIANMILNQMETIKNWWPDCPTIKALREILGHKMGLKVGIGKDLTMEIDNKMGLKMGIGKDLTMGIGKSLQMGIGKGPKMEMELIKMAALVDL